MVDHRLPMMRIRTLLPFLLLLPACGREEAVPGAIDLLSRPYETVDPAGNPLATSVETVPLHAELRAGGKLQVDDNQASAISRGDGLGFWILELGRFKSADFDSLSVSISAPGPGSFLLDLRFDDERVERRVIKYSGNGSSDEHVVRWPPNVRTPSSRPLSLEIHPPKGVAGRIELSNLRLHRSPHARQVLGRVDHQARRCMQLEPGASVQWEFVVPPSGRLQFGANLALSDSVAGTDALTLRVQVVEETGLAQALWERSLEQIDDPDRRPWEHARVDLSRWAGKKITLRFSCVGEQDGATTLLLSSPTVAVENSGKQPNVIVLVIDSLRADGLGIYGNDRDTSPNIDSLADESAIFERVHSTAPWTLPSTATLFTGMLPNHHGVGMVRKRSTTFREGTQLVTERFKEAGYATAAVTDNRLIASDRGFSPGMDQFDERSLRGGLNHGAERVTRYALEWLERHSDEPYFLYLHYFDPHWPYQAPQPFTEKFVGPRLNQRMKNDFIRSGDLSQLRRSFSKMKRPLDMNDAKTKMTVNYLRALYDSETFYCDSEIGKLIQWLRVSGQLENTLLIITADHGEEFADHGWLGHGHSLFEELLHIPLLIRFPDGTGAGQRYDAPASIQDLAATVLGFAGLPMLNNAGFSDFDLHAALRSGTLDSRGPLFASGPGVDENKGLPGKHGPKQMLLEWPQKLIYSNGNGRLELFDLDADLLEQSPAHIDTEPDTIDELLIRLDNAMQRPEGWEEGVTKMTPQLLEELRALGYVD